MSIERVFLGWSGPCLPLAAAWLAEHHRIGRRWDLSALIIATPGRRAGRRLLELIVHHAGQADLALTPPHIVTAGELADLLFEPDRSVAGALQCDLARLESIRRAPRALLEQIVHDPPADDDLIACWSLGRDLARLHEQLAADAVKIEQVNSAAEHLADFRQHDRWSALAEVQQQYERLIDVAGFDDPHTARFRALEAGGLACDRRIVLVATADLNRMTRLMLEQTNADTTALVHAPPGRADRFDADGSVIVDAWHDQLIELSPADLQVVDRPRDQAWQVARTIEKLTDVPADTGGGAAGSNTAPGPSLDHITIGLGDEADALIIERVLDMAGAPARSPLATTIGRTRPAALMLGVAEFAASRRLDDFASLLRHPDIERYLRRQLAEPPAAQAVTDWLSLLDRYATDHLQQHLTGRWLGRPDAAEPLKAVYDAVVDLCDFDGGRTRPLPQWSQPMAAILQRIFGRDRLLRSSESDHQLITALDAIATALREQAELDEARDHTPHVTFSEAARLTIERIAAVPVPPTEHEPAIEMLGWLELQLDDAPVLIVTSVNEGRIPQSRSSDAFLPDALRAALGVSDNRRRFARDVVMLTAIVQSRPHVTFIGCRTSGEGEPLSPSRLLLRCPPDALPGRIARFYSDQPETGLPRPALIAPGSNQFTMPPPRALQKPDPPINKLRVTAFKDYLACPYRFYLKHVLGIDTLDDKAVEFGGAQFGSIAHEVLARFAADELADSNDAERIGGYLTQRLAQRIEAVAGADPPAAVIIQHDQLRRRLLAFARWHAAQFEAGWRVQRNLVEAEMQAELDVDGQPFTIVGRIDRIDLHPDRGYRIIDYKTADAGDSPEKTHRVGRAGAKRWTDLQLPLYHLLAEPRGVTGAVELGYLLLPKDVENVGFKPSGWSDDDIGSAVAEAERITRDIRNGVFWPPGQALDFDDGLAAICMDAALQRDRIIADVPDAAPA